MVMGMASAEAVCGPMIDLALCLTCFAIAARVLLGSAGDCGGSSRTSTRRQLLLYLYLLSLGLMLAGVGRAATALAPTMEPAAPATSAQLLPPVMALATSLLCVTSACLLALTAPRLVRQWDGEPSAPSLGDLEKASPRAREPQTGRSWSSGTSQSEGKPSRRPPSARLMDDKLRFAAEALQLNSKQAMLLVAALCDLLAQC